MPNPLIALRRGAAIGAVAILTATLAACGAPDEAGGSPATGGDLNLQFNGSPVSLNPALAASGGSTVYTHLAYDPLIYLDSDGEYVPSLAESWQYTNDDNTTFELVLRDGVEFASGAPLDAEAVKASMEYFLEAGGMMVPRVGPIESVEAVADDTVHIHYSAPYPDAPHSLTQYFQLGAIIGPDGLADPDSLLTTSDGTGQYIYDASRSVVDASYVYERNANYWAPDAQMFDTVTVHVMAEPNAVLSAISTGQIDYAIGDRLTASAAEQAGLDVLTAPYYIWALQILDRDGELNPALGDQRVRQAMQMALDRDAIVDAIGTEFAVKNGQVVNEGAQGYIPGLGEEHDVEAAKQLLAEAGYPDGFTLQLATTPSMDPQSVNAQAIASSLEQIGVTVDIVVESTGLPQMLQRSESKEFEAMALPVTGTHVGEAVQDLNGRLNLNPWQVTDPEVTELYNASLTASEDERPQVFEQLNERWNELAWVLPVYAQQQLFYVSDGVTNVVATAGNANPMPVGPAPEHVWQPATG
ncbi:peptide ABC transporter substrate-binding protein [Pseudoclavibacter endophyticus]|uniref:ABC transporter substrate-binding protein n=1 Tax=Pseudoclavibacter endophyticus TaxID=1778590 RepID=A0A6H9WCS9_9MICO|nr:ABC transporter substrate-binding protein [Pseudoclavibacter endophyticus]KAB1648759.1 ABC transporter substrate-binding protein [Pseudoclavibacter endophyticus]GGA68740.1 peptide ABC transporter substrate-binding protein [Pseudoclavibacter endophyticus]